MSAHKVSVSHSVKQCLIVFTYYLCLVCYYVAVCYFHRVHKMLPHKQFKIVRVVESSMLILSETNIMQTA